MAETVDEMVIKWSMDTSKFDAGVTSINRSMNVLKSEFKATDTGLKDFGKSTDHLKNKQDYLSKAIELQKKKVDTLKAAYEKSRAETGENSNATQNLAIKVNNAARYYATLENQLKETNTQLEKETSIFSKIDGGLGTLQSGFSKLGDGFTELGKKMSIVTAGITAIGKKSVDSYKEVKEGMDNITKATGATGQAAEDLENTYKSVASNSGASFDVIGSAIGEINTRFGFTDKQLEDCTNSFLKFAKITGSDATESVQKISRYMGDASINSDEYGKVLDNVAKAAQVSGIGIQNLTENLVKYGAPMRALGFDTEENIALFSSWEKAGVNTEIAFSGMKKAISNWSKDGKDSRVEFKKTLDEIKACPDIASATTKAIEVFGQKAGPDMADAIKGGRFEYSEMLKQIQGSSGTVNDTAGQMADGTTKAKVAMNNLKLAQAEVGQQIMSTLAPFIDQATQKIKDFSNWFKSLSDEQQKNIVKYGMIVAAIGPVLLIIGSLCKSISNVIGLGRDVVKIGKDSFDVLKKIATSDVWANGIKSIKSIGTAMLDGAKAAGQFALQLGKTALQLAKTAIQAAASTIKLIAQKVAMVASTVATKAMEIAQAALNLVMSLNPIGLIIIAVGALIAILVVLYNKCDGFRALVNNLFSKLKDALMNIINFIKNNWQTILLFIVNPFAGAFKILYDKCEWFRNIVNKLGEGIKNVFFNVVNSIKNRFIELRNFFVGIVQGIVNGVVKCVNFIIKVLNKLSFNVPDWVPGIGGKHFGFNINEVSQVKWLYEGGIIDKPTILGGIGVGDAYKGMGHNAEAVIPLDQMYGNINQMMKKNLAEKSKPIIIKNFMDSQEISQFTYNNVGNQLALAGRRVR